MNLCGTPTLARNHESLWNRVVHTREVELFTIPILWPPGLFIEIISTGRLISGGITVYAIFCSSHGSNKIPHTRMEYFVRGPKVTNKCQLKTLNEISVYNPYFFTRPTHQIASMCRASLSGQFGIWNPWLETGASLLARAIITRACNT